MFREAVTQRPIASGGHTVPRAAPIERECRMTAPLRDQQMKNRVQQAQPCSVLRL